jgi:hypothetical protein
MKPILSGSKELRQVRDTSEGSPEMAATCCGFENRHEENATAQNNFPVPVLAEPRTEGSNLETGEARESNNESAPTTKGKPTSLSANSRDGENLLSRRVCAPLRASASEEVGRASLSFVL